MKKLIFLILLLIASPVFSADIFWVSTTGTGSLAQCESDADPGGAESGTNYCALATVNAMTAGQKAYLKAGRYTWGSGAYAIDPDNSGTLANRITWEAAAGETPILDGDGASQQRGVSLNANDYIVIKGITFEDIFQAIFVSNGSDYVEIDSNDIYHTATSLHSGAKQPAIYVLANGGNQSLHAWIHDNEVHYMGFTACGEGHDGIKVSQYNATDRTSNNATIEGNTIYNMGHVTVTVFSQYNVIRNNISHNEGWKANPGGCTYVPDGGGNYPGDNQYGHRNFEIANATPTGSGYPLYNLVEGNRIGYASINPANNGADGISLSAAYNILRYNYIFGGDGPGIYWKSLVGSSATNNMVYNNTIYYNGRFTGSTSGAPPILYGLEYQSIGTDSSIVNNIIKANVGGDVKCQGCVATEATVFPLSDWRGNLCDATKSLVGCTAGNPLFTSTDMSDMTSATEPTLELAGNSPAINAGTYLTTTNGTGSSATAFVVDNSLYFQAGSAAATTPIGSSLSSIAADFICYSTSATDATAGQWCVQITDINHTTKTLTLASAQTWADGEYVWLQKNSAGTVVLTGSAPDIGAFEAASVGEVSGTITADNMTESTIVAGGATIIIDIVNDTLVADDGTFAAARAAMIAGMDSAGAEATGWDAEVKAKEVVGAVVRTDADTITITLSAAAAYAITANETITVTIPASMLVTSTSAVVAAPTFFISNENPAASVSSGVIGIATGAPLMGTATGAPVLYDTD